MGNEDFTKSKLKMRQAMPLDLKIRYSELRITDWYNHFGGNVYISFSGGKDSTVLLDLVRRQYPDVPAVFADTGLEYPEIRNFVKTIDNVIWLKPSKTFLKIITQYGFPVISKHVSMCVDRYRNTKSEEQKRIRLYGSEKGNAGKLPDKWHFLINAPFKISEKCCHYLKKHPFVKYERESGRMGYIGTMASEGLLRMQSYKKYGCNAFEAKRPQSRPMSFWLDTDVWEYLKTRNVPYSKIYDMGEERTGCMFCTFGVHCDGTPNRFQRMAKSHPTQYKYCIEKLGIGEVLDYLDISYEEIQEMRDE